MIGGRQPELLASLPDELLAGTEPLNYESLRSGELEVNQNSTSDPKVLSLSTTQAADGWQSTTTSISTSGIGAGNIHTTK